MQSCCTFNHILFKTFSVSILFLDSIYPFYVPQTALPLVPRAPLIEQQNRCRTNLKRFRLRIEQATKVLHIYKNLVHISLSPLSLSLSLSLSPLSLSLSLSLSFSLSISPLSLFLSLSLSLSHSLSLFKIIFIPFILFILSIFHKRHCRWCPVRRSLSNRTDVA